MLDLEIFSSCKYDISFFVITSKISGSIHSLFCSIYRIQHKLLRCLLRFFIIAIRQRFSCRADFPLYTRFCHLFAFLVYKDYSSSRERLTGRYFLTVLILSLNRKIRTVASNLCRSIQVYKLCFRQFFLPDTQLFWRHCFSAEHNSFH